MYLPMPDCVDLPQNVLWKHGAYEAAADRSQGSYSDTYMKIHIEAFPQSSRYGKYFHLQP